MSLLFGKNNPLMSTFQRVFASFYGENCFPPARGHTIAQGSRDFLAKTNQESQAATLVEKQERSEPGTKVMPSPPLGTSLPGDSRPRSVTMEASAIAIDKKDSTDLRLEEAATKPVVSTTNLSTPKPTPDLKNATTTDPPKPTVDRVEALVLKASDLGPRKKAIDSRLKDTFLDGQLAAAQLKWGKTSSPPQGEEEAIAAILESMSKRIVADEFLIALLDKDLLLKSLKGPGRKLISVDFLQDTLDRTNDDGDYLWPEARAEWESFLLLYALDPRNNDDAASRIRKVADGLDKPGKGENFEYSGAMTADDFDDQEKGKIKDILLGGPKGVWGGRIGTEYTGEAIEMDHYTIPSSNKTIFFRWKDDVLEVHGYGQHTRANTEYIVHKWSSGRKGIGINLKVKKPKVT